VKAARWLDHLPPWLAWGAIVSTGIYSPGETAFMALPLLGAALAEWRAWDLGRWRRVLEIAALACFLLLLAARLGLLPTVVLMLFVLCGARLALPRALAQRRQILLMGFLIFLTTAVTTSELDFLVWSLLWVAGASTALLQQNWEKAALLRQGPLQRPPYRLVARWTLAAVLIAGGFFVILPRLHLGLRSLPVGMQSLGGAQAGLSDVLDLGGQGPIQGSHDVVLRLLPPPALADGNRAAFEEAMGLLRGFVLEQWDGRRWEIDDNTAPRPGLQWAGIRPGRRPLAGELFMAPGLQGLIPLPYGNADLEAPPAEPLRNSRGAALRWVYPVRRISELQMALTPAVLERDRPPRGQRLATLTATGRHGRAALAWSLRVAPVDLPPAELAAKLTAGLRRFRYTLDNPSGGAANPLEDFLERTQAGHCEYFASALALMLRHRGVPARVANGYRLGPWIQEGGYYLVTQNEAHSWVEYYDEAAGGWRVADPTPGAPPSALDAASFAAVLARWTDALRFRWDHYVVRFSDQEQVAGLEWLRTHLDPSRWPLPSRAWLAGLGLLAALGVALWAWLRDTLPTWPGQAPRQPGALRELAPLLRRVRKEVPPLPGETARAWLARLALARPQRSAPLERLAQEADAVAYGRKPPAALRALVRQERRHWRDD